MKRAATATFASLLLCASHALAGDARPLATPPRLAQAAEQGLERVPPIPDNAIRAKMSRPDGRRVLMDGEPMRLAPGAHIRDENNRIVLPSHVRAPVTVRYTLDGRREIRQVWILPAE